MSGGPSYYVRVPFVDGTPEYSWLMDPARYNDADKLLAHLHEMNMRWIVKSPNYPKALAPRFPLWSRKASLSRSPRPTLRILREPDESRNNARKFELSCWKFASKNFRA